MNEFPRDPLLYVLIFVAVALFNYMLRRLEAWRKRQEQLPRPGAPPPRVRPAAESTRRVRPAARGEPAAGAPAILLRRVEAQAASPTTRTAADARSLVTGRRNLRRAVIAMTVLGPCRSQDPL
jgi:hypothetical protein